MKFDHKQEDLFKATKIKSEHKLKKHTDMALKKRMLLEIDGTKMDLAKKEKLSLIMMGLQIIDAEEMAGVIFEIHQTSRIIEALLSMFNDNQYSLLATSVINNLAKDK